MELSDGFQYSLKSAVILLAVILLALPPVVLTPLYAHTKKAAFAFILWIVLPDLVGTVVRFPPLAHISHTSGL